jgi:hypothetical protein
MSLRVITTNAGKAAILNAEAQGLALTITHLAAGAAGYTPAVTATALQDERDRVEIASSRKDAAAYRLDLNAALDSTEEYWVREVGFFAADGTLIFLWSAPEAEFTLGYKSAPVRFLLGLSLTVVDVPLESIVIADQGQPLELSLALIEEDLGGTHPVGEFHNYQGTDWQETDWLVQAVNWEAQAELVRANGQSGIVNVRQYNEGGTEPFNRPQDGSFAVLNIHNHPNYPAMCGIAEISAAINGYYVRTRHNDYRIVAAAAGDYLAYTEIGPPAVPASVTAFPAVSDQVTEMRAYFQAMAAADTGLRDFRTHFRWTLSVLEIWPEIMDADRQFQETYPSFRHMESTLEMRAQMERVLELAATGWKPRAENVSTIPGSARQITVNGEPRWVLWRFRIICKDVGNLQTYPIATLLTLADRPNVRWHLGQTLEQLRLTRSARFSVNRALAADHYEGSYNGLDLLDTLMAMVPGLSGPGANITESHPSNESNAYIYGTTSPLNAAFYNRKFSYSIGASGRTTARRGWNDPTLFTALTNRPEVAPVTSGAYSYRASYAIPLELILRTPLEAWNPYALPQIADTVAPTGLGTQASPYNGYRNKDYYYLTPGSFFSGAAGNPDQADTDPGNVWIYDTGNVACAVRAAGIYVHLPAISGITPDIRLRYPIYPVYHDGSYANALLQSTQGDMSRASIALAEFAMAEKTRTDALAQQINILTNRLNQLG